MLPIRQPLGFSVSITGGNDVFFLDNGILVCIYIYIYIHVFVVLLFFPLVHRPVYLLVMLLAPRPLQYFFAVRTLRYGTISMTQRNENIIYIYIYVTITFIYDPLTTVSSAFSFFRCLYVVGEAFLFSQWTLSLLVFIIILDLLKERFRGKNGILPLLAKIITSFQQMT